MSQDASTLVHNPGRRQGMDQHAITLIQKALAFDSPNDQKPGNLRKAYEAYREALICMLQGAQAKDLHLAMMQNCLDRMTILDTWLKGPSAGGCIPEKDERGRKSDGKSSEDEDEYLKFVQGASGRSSVSSSKSPRPSISQPPLRPRTSPDLDLTAMRRQHEKTLLAKLHSQKMLRQRLQSTSTENEAIVRQLLWQRQINLSRFKERVTEWFSGLSAKATELQSELRLRFEEETWRRTLSQAVEEEAEVFSPLADLLTSPTHPIALLVRDFMQRERRILLEEEPPKAASTFFLETNVFCEQLVDLLQTNYAGLAKDTRCKLLLKVTIGHVLFATPLSAMALAVLRRVHARTDAGVLAALVQLGWQDTYRMLNVLPRFASAALYEDAVRELRSMALCTTAHDKMRCLVGAGNAICREVEASLSGLPSEGEHVVVRRRTEDAALGSEDLLTLFAYVLVRAQVPDLHAQLAFISELIPEEMIRGEAGYMLATVQTSLLYIEQHGGGGGG